MSDSKKTYHENALKFAEHADETEQDKRRVEIRKDRERRFKGTWPLVDIEEVRKRYAPKDPHGHKQGYKWNFEDNPEDHKHGYVVSCDMITGSLRVFLKIPHTKKSKIKRKAIHIEDNTIGEDKDTHYRIKKRNGNDTAKGIQRTLKRRKNKKNKKKHGKTSDNDNQ
ncbi:hypothetical protein PSRA_1216 [Pseudoscardovia radai]|uniref:Uncharacterized protein n=1 Tax=Pseudoscardovia radai TaxID=987066 RepID=A0A261EWN7_9BIFI|nr:hypothetical protein [Pseudoscardovia radai]OZG51272.1 hypothetical protein PSRA_1216 [Pseudoscardovia radai]